MNDSHAGGRPAGRPKNQDHTAFLMGKFLRVLGASSYEVCWHRAEPFSHGTVVGGAATIHAELSRLKALNAHGHHIWVMPADGSPLVMVDLDHNPGAPEDAVWQGVQPVAVVNSSPGRYQMWVRLGQRPVAADVLVAIARHLTREYRGDPAAATAHRYGRLPGFTNRKPEHQMPNGQFPFVKLGYCRVGPCTRAAELLALGRAQVAERAAAAAEPPVFRGRAAAAGVSSPVGRLGYQQARASHETLCVQFRQRCKSRLNRFGDTDFSRMEYAVAKELTLDFAPLSVEELAAVIRDGTVRHECGRKVHEWAWCLRTANRALTDARSS